MKHLLILLCIAEALIMTHAYSNAIFDKIQEAIKNGLVGNDDDDDW